MTINYLYLSFLSKQIELFSLFEYIVFILLFFYLIILFYSILLSIILHRIKKQEKINLLKYEGLLINLKNLYNRGQINAKQYKDRINNINNKFTF